MTPFAVRDTHGLSRWFYHHDAQRPTSTLRELLADSAVPCRLDPVGVRIHLGLAPPSRPTSPPETCFADIKALGPGCALIREGSHSREVPAAPAASPQAARSFDLVAQLAEVLGGMLEPGTALALGGGLDSALLLAVLRRVLGRHVPVFSLAPTIAGYSEREAVEATGRALELVPTFLEVGEADFRRDLADCIALTEVPLYNLHPVSKLLFARRVKALGIRRVITGDGADQVFAGVPGWDYLPLVGALFAGAGVELLCPFLDPRIAAPGRIHADREKSMLREAASRLLPATLARSPKVPQLAPAMDLAGVVQPELLSRARDLLSGSRASADPSDVRTVTLALLFRHFPRLLG